MYAFLKLLHILCAIIGLGFTSTFAIIGASAAGKTDAMRFAVALIQRLEKISRVAFFGLIITGGALGGMSGLRFGTLWFSGSLGLTLTAMVIAFTVASPTLTAQVALLAKPDFSMDEMKRLAMRSRMTGMVLGVMSLTTLSLMVFKPG